jgi:4'-phosphopantetheinyl transferase EntD
VTRSRKRDKEPRISSGSARFNPGFDEVTDNACGDKARSLLSERLNLLARSAHPRLCAACREISAGDEFALTPAELRPMERSIASVRRASGAARIVARGLLAKLGVSPDVELPRSPTRAPQWPQGFVGSLAHDRQFAAAAVAPSTSLRGVGIDIEPAEPLPEDLLETIATRSEQSEINGDLVLARLLFCMKEAVYKATNPLDGVFLEHHDVEVSLTSRVAVTSSGHRLKLYTIARPRLVALALFTPLH